MKKPAFPLLSLLSLLISIHANAGAVSAGGMQMSASVECLFLDAESPFEPLNFMSFESGKSKSAVLVEVDLRNRKTLASYSTKFLKVSKARGKTSYSGAFKAAEDNEESDLRLTVDRNETLAHDDYIANFSSLTSIPHVNFEKNAVGHHATLQFQKQKLSGICADGPLFYYPANR